MKHFKKLLAAASLLSLAFPAFAAAGNTTVEQTQAQITSNVAQIAATANVGMISTRITAMVAPSFSTGGTGGFTPSFTASQTNTLTWGSYRMGRL